MRGSVVTIEVVPLAHPSAHVPPWPPFSGRLLGAHCLISRGCQAPGHFPDHDVRPLGTLGGPGRVPGTPAPVLFFQPLPRQLGPPSELSWALHSGRTELGCPRPILERPCLECNSRVRFLAGGGWRAGRCAENHGTGRSGRSSPGSSAPPSPQPSPSLARAAPAAAAVRRGPGRRCARAGGP